MSVKPIRLFGDPVLRTPAEPVRDFDAELRRLVKGRTEPEPPEPQPETKIVRQQPVRQPRSRRSGKR